MSDLATRYVCLAGVHEGSTHTGARDRGGNAGGTSNQQPASGSVSVSDASLLIMSVTSDGRVWAWDAPLPHPAGQSLIRSPAGAQTGNPATFSLTSLGSTVPPGSTGGTLGGGAVQAVPPPAAAPQLVGLLHSLPHSVTTLALHQRPVLTGRQHPLPHSLRSRTVHHVGGERSSAGFGAAVTRMVEEVVVVGAAVTAGGSLEVFSVQQGQAAPLSVETSLSLVVHKDSVVRGVRWLGTSPRVVTFSSERVNTTGAGDAGCDNALVFSGAALLRTMALSTCLTHVRGR